MKALIFAAGLGTRLKPLTDNKPKALVEIEGETLLYYAIQKLKNHGYNQIIINTHHFSNQIIEYTKSLDLNVQLEISDETDNLLNTGGGLQKARWFFDDDAPFLVYNVDILSNIDIDDMLKQHKESNALVTLAVMDRKTSRYLLFDSENNLCGWRNKNDEKEIIIHQKPNLQEFAFSGIQIINPKYFSLVKKEGSFPIIDVYLNLAKENTIKAYNHSGTVWCDFGKLPELENARHIIKSMY